MTEKKRQKIYASKAWIAAQDDVHKFMHLADRMRSDPAEFEAALASKAEAIARRDALLAE